MQVFRLNRNFCFFCLLIVPAMLLPVAASAQVLRFDPDPFIPTEPQFSVPLVLETGGMEVKGVEATVTFDPALVTLVSITAGPWYTNSGQDFFFWDYTEPSSVTIHFASAMLDGTSSDDGIIALCNFSFLDFGVCPLEFTSTKVRNANNDDLPHALDPGVIFLEEAVQTQAVKFSALKAIYR